ncbi:TIM-barrel domain-containing protein [Knoellia sp. CPCC 206453]|uniref:TIM-barrel domain-containing protein n=1 Tax=Knoellia pratensis TaxID=3404796 RepID=UPI00360C4079
MFSQRSGQLLALATAGAVAFAGLVAVPASAEAATGQLGNITSFAQAGDTYTVRSGTSALRVVAEDNDLLRVEVAPDGTFTDPANEDPTDPAAPDADIVVKTDYAGAHSTVKESATAYEITTGAARLTITKSPITLHLAKADGTPLWDETAPLSWNDSGTTQSLKQGTTEQFFGGGMQNGRFSHRDSEIAISRDYNWNDGGNPNASPFYVSSRGYGVLRNTFAPGTYDFHAPVKTTHDEQRFDAYYFVGDAKQVINGLTELTGRPIALPMYALEMGDADCYLHNANRGERETLRDSTAIAKGYKDNGFPLGWMLVNDGYNCDYEDLPETGDMLHANGAELGLWTQRDLTNQESEVEAGVRVRKTDVAWVGPGYRFALDACEKSRDGIEQNSTDRATVVTVEGWAGTQRCGIPWSGDQSGTWDYIRWQIPTYAGSTMSGQHVTTGDVDGIFGGSAQTYARDLQWKMMLPMTYAMSGWAASDKQPYRYGEPFTSINRKYMMLHERLLPYFYTHTMNATKDGVGATRPLYLEYPQDPNTWGDAAKYEFLAGKDFLVAPVYSDTSVRDDIYLPKGQWVDYWTGRSYQGGQTIDGHKAPLDTLPMFVRAGAVVPMFPEGTMDWKDGKDAGQLDLDVYPSGTSTFTNYEDDGRSQSHAAGQSATQRFDVTAPVTGRGPVTIALGALNGSYAGKPGSRHYGLSVHTDAAPDGVTVGSTALKPVASADALKTAASGYFYDTATGVIRVKTPSLATGSASSVRITGAGAVGGSHPQERDVTLDLQVPRISVSGESTPVKTVFTNNTGKPVDVTTTSITAPAGWAVKAAGPTTATAVKDGAAFTANFTVTPPAEAKAGTRELTGTTAYTARDVSRTITDRASTTLAFGELADAFNNVGVTASADPTPGNIDGGGSSFLAERLAEKGVTPGATVAANGFSFTWPDAQPGTKNNVASTGETIALEGKGNALAVLGTGTSGSASGSATVHYADGTVTTGVLGLPNWCCLATDSFGSKIAVVTKGKNTPTGPAYPTTEYRLYTKTLRIDPAKDVVAVTLPANSAVHVFGMAVGTEEVIPPPIANGQYAITTGGKALQATDQELGQLIVAAPSTDADQKWVVTQNADETTYQLKNAGTGLCADVPYSSTTSGQGVGQYTCSGTPNQQWVISKAAGGLTFKAKHSGLSLTVSADGKVVQATDTAAANQRWAAAAN